MNLYLMLRYGQTVVVRANSLYDAVAVIQKEFPSFADDTGIRPALVKLDPNGERGVIYDVTS